MKTEYYKLDMSLHPIEEERDSIWKIENDKVYLYLNNKNEWHQILLDKKAFKENNNNRFVKMTEKDVFLYILCSK
jgi:hypothetical protein